METISPFSHPLYVMLKPTGALCNLRCKYCYYLSKRGLYPKKTSQTMSDEVLSEFIKQYIGAQTGDDVLFCWHGGEPMMLPIRFYERVIRLQQLHANGHRISNCIQTNGTMITLSWAKFLRDHKWLVGVSIDGNEEFHNKFRRTVHSLPTWERVMRGIDILNRYNVEWNAMAVVNDYNADYPEDFYRFFRDELGCRYLQFAPIVERGLDCNVSSDQWGEFLCRMFDEWVRNDVGTMFVQMFDATLANWVGETPGVCTLAPTCGHAAVMEHNGDVYSCDHFVFPEHKLGNILDTPLVAMMYGERQLSFGRAKRDALPSKCKECEWLFACNGECPKNRTESGVNVLCGGYRRFLSHVAPYMDRMGELLRQGLPPAEVMKWRV